MFIFLGMGIACLAVLIFLISRFCKFSMLKRQKKPVKMMLASLIVLAGAAAVGVLLDVINLAIILVHLGVIWILCDAADRLRKHMWHSRRGACDLTETKDTSKSDRYWAGAAALVVTTCYLACGWYLDHLVWEKHYVISTEKPVGNLRIVMFADLHIGTTFHGEGFAEQCRRMQAANPDLVVVAGDYVDDDTSRADMIACCKALGTLKTTYGVYFAFGNHDKGYYPEAYRGYSDSDLIAELEKNGVRILQDETELVDSRLYLIGRKDRSEEELGGSRASMEELMDGLDSQKFSIVLDHQPHDYAAQERAGADLVLSGHTHGGQLFPINYLGEWTRMNEKTYGMEKRGNTHFIVTSGISDWAIKFKTGCKSEFVVIDVEGR